MEKDRLQEIIDKIIQFDKEREWGPGTPINMAASISLEAAELLEHFQWDGSNTKSLDEILKSKDWNEIGSEAVDILWYLLKFCHYYKIDIYEAFQKKYEHNSKKYPVVEVEDKNKFYDAQHKKYREMKKTK